MGFVGRSTDQLPRTPVYGTAKRCGWRAPRVLRSLLRRRLLLLLRQRHDPSRNPTQQVSAPTSNVVDCIPLQTLGPVDHGQARGRDNFQPGLALIALMRPAVIRAPGRERTWNPAHCNSPDFRDSLILRVPPSETERTWEFIAVNDVHHWTWRSVMLDGSTEIASDYQGVSFGAALGDAVAHGFDPAVHRWEVKSGDPTDRHTPGGPSTRALAGEK